MRLYGYRTKSVIADSGSVTTAPLGQHLWRYINKHYLYLYIFCVCSLI